MDGMYEKVQSRATAAMHSDDERFFSHVKFCGAISNQN